MGVKDLKGKQFEYILPYGAGKVQAFIAEIDPNKGLTMHVLDKEGILESNYCNKDGEIFCINFNRPHRGDIELDKKAFNLIAKTLQEGDIFDRDAFYTKMGLGLCSTTFMIPCAFK